MQITDTHTPASLNEVYRHLSVDDLIESGHNPRRHFDEQKLDELAASIKERGIVEPLVVRPLVGVTPKRYEIVAGARRFRAAKRAGLDRVPAIERPYSDEAVLELVLIENLQRDDLAPLEQATGFKALIDSNPEKHTVAAIATRIGMSPAWVWDRLKLHDLIPEAKQLLADARITVGHAILLSRLKAEDQQRAIDPRHPGMSVAGGLWRRAGYTLYADVDDRKDTYAGLMPVSIREFEGWIKTQVRFDVTHAAQAQPLEFAETAAKVQAAAAEPERGKKVVSITYDHRVSDAAKADDERTYGRESWVRADGQAKSKTCTFSVLGVIVAGRDYGQTLQVCVARETCRVHYGALIKAKEQAAKLRIAGKPAQAAKKEKRAADTWQEQQRQRDAERKAFEAFKPIGLKAIAAAVPDRPFTDAIAASLVDVNRHHEELFWACLGGGVTVENVARALVLAEVFDRSWSQEELAKFGKQYGVDIKALRKQHDAQLSSPAQAAAKKTTKPSAAKKAAKALPAKKTAAKKKGVRS